MKPFSIVIYNSPRLNSLWFRHGQKGPPFPLICGHSSASHYFGLHFVSLPESEKMHYCRLVAGAVRLHATWLGRNGGLYLSSAESGSCFLEHQIATLVGLERLLLRFLKRRGREIRNKDPSQPSGRLALFWVKATPLARKPARRTRSSRPSTRTRAVT